MAFTKEISKLIVGRARQIVLLAVPSVLAVGGIENLATPRVVLAQQANEKTLPRPAKACSSCITRSKRTTKPRS